MDFIDPLINQYALDHTENESPLLNELNRQTHINILQPRMLSGHLQGRILSVLSKSIRPKNILEIGTYTGYSALCMAEGLSKDGNLYTIDINEEIAPFAQEFFDKSQYKNQITMLIGNALNIIPELNENWDLVFIDADKVNYGKYYQMIFPYVKKNGLIIADNVLFHGEVFSETLKGKNAKAIHAFNEMIMSDELADTVLLTVRDGLSLIRKK
jgi:caffeoyl-CoA O-methyltransferase